MNITVMIFTVAFSCLAVGEYGQSYGEKAKYIASKKTKKAIEASVGIGSKGNHRFREHAWLPMS
jgi:hypothetical protein